MKMPWSVMINRNASYGGADEGGNFFPFMSGII